LKDNIFSDCLERWKKSDGHSGFWGELAAKWGYLTSEAIRQDFKYERKKRGIKKEENVVIEEPKESPRIGVLDIETLPMEVYTFGLFDQNIGIEQIISDMCILSWAGKFLNDSEIYSDILTSKEAPKKDDKRITQSAHEFISKCDIVIGHNFVNFDGKILNGQFLLHGLLPLRYITVDTLMVAKNNFRFSSNKLKFINDKLGIRNKQDNDGFPLWKACHQGKQEFLNKMLSYNLDDVVATEDLFYKIRPYVKNFNVALYNEIDEYQCPVCGSKNLKVDGYKYLSSGKYESVRCLDCGNLSRKKTNLLSTRKRKSILIG
jgi:hypothetical protein